MIPSSSDPTGGPQLLWRPQGGIRPILLNKQADCREIRLLTLVAGPSPLWDPYNKAPRPIPKSYAGMAMLAVGKRPPPRRTVTAKRRPAV